MHMSQQQMMDHISIHNMIHYDKQFKILKTQNKSVINGMLQNKIYTKKR